MTTTTTTNTPLRKLIEDKNMDVDTIKAKIDSLNTVVTETLPRLAKLEKEIRTQLLNLSVLTSDATNVKKILISSQDTVKELQLLLVEEEKKLEVLLQNVREETVSCVLEEFRYYIMTSKNQLESLEHYKERADEIIKEYIDKKTGNTHTAYGVLRQSRMGGNNFTLTYFKFGGETSDNGNVRMEVRNNNIYTVGVETNGKRTVGDGTLQCSFSLKSLQYWLSTKRNLHLINLSESIVHRKYCRDNYDDDNELSKDYDWSTERACNEINGTQECKSEPNQNKNVGIYSDDIEGYEASIPNPNQNKNVDNYSDDNELYKDYDWSTERACNEINGTQECKPKPNQNKNVGSYSDDIEGYEASIPKPNPNQNKNVGSYSDHIEGYDINEIKYKFYSK